MNKTCKDCIHYDVCGYAYDEQCLALEDDCSHFKDKSRYIELPCAVGDYVRFKGLASLWKVCGIHFYKEGLPQFNATNTNGKVTTTFTELDSFEVVSKEDAEKVLKGGE